MHEFIKMTTNTVLALIPQGRCSIGMIFQSFNLIASCNALENVKLALANNPKVLLADEPTGNLDSETSSEIIGLLKRLNKDHGLSIILVTHDQETAEAVSDRIIRLKDGQVVKFL